MAAVAADDRGAAQVTAREGATARSKVLGTMLVSLALASVAVASAAPALAASSLVARCKALDSLSPGDHAVVDALIRTFAENGLEYRGCQDLALTFVGMYVRIPTSPIPNVALLREAHGVDSVWLECRTPPSASTIAGVATLPLVNFQLTNDTVEQPGCGVVDLAALSHTKTLEKIYVSNVDIASVEPFADLDRLDNLTVASSSVRDLAPIHRLVQLRTLYLHGNQLTRLLDLMSLVNLTELNLSFNDELTDLMGVQYMSNLRRLSLNHGALTDVRPLGALVWLEELLLNRNQLVDVSVLGGLPRLRVVGLSGNAIEDISALGKLEHLEELMLGKNPIRDYLPIAKPGVRKLDMEAATHVTDWSFLSRMEDLEELVLYHSQISDLEPLTEALAELPRFRHLEISSNRVRDFSSLRRLHALRYLGIADNGLTSLESLVGNVDLDELGVGHDPGLHFDALPRIRTRRVTFGGMAEGSVPCPAGMRCYYQDF
jgi:Leucine-rich repeat (LRR) protein